MQNLLSYKAINEILQLVTNVWHYETLHLQH